MTRVVNGNREAFDVYIGRPSIWGNPYKMRKEADRSLVIRNYARWLLMQPRMVARVAELRGKVLGCHCAPRACHGDVLALLADGVPPDCLELFI